MLQENVPADDKGPEFADGDVGVDVGRSSFRHPTAELGVAQSRQDGSQSGDDEGDDNGRTRQFVGHRSRQHVDSGTDHVTNS